MSKTREIKVSGTTVDVYTFGTRSFYYPSFNGNAEFPVSSVGYRALSSYIRTCNYYRNIVNKIMNP